MRSKYDKSIIYFLKCLCSKLIKKSIFLNYLCSKFIEKTYIFNNEISLLGYLLAKEDKLSESDLVALGLLGLLGILGIGYT